MDIAGGGGWKKHRVGWGVEVRKNIEVVVRKNIEVVVRKNIEIEIEFVVDCCCCGWQE